MRTTLDLPDDLYQAPRLGHRGRYLAEWTDRLGRGHWTGAYLAAFALAGAIGW